LLELDESVRACSFVEKGSSYFARRAHKLSMKVCWGIPGTKTLAKARRSQLQGARSGRSLSIMSSYVGRFGAVQ
jgi:hypothetical protein